MPTSSPAEAPAAAAFVCESARVFKYTVCEGLPFYKEHRSKGFCVLHYPGKDKDADFDEVLKKKLDAQDFNFSGVWFPDEVDFSNFIFTKPVKFSNAYFNTKASFRSATFNSMASFWHARFSSEADFIWAKFKADATFGGVKFQALANFREVAFSAEADFDGAKFAALADFDQATFKDYVRFSGRRLYRTEREPGFADKASLSLQFARIEKPDRVSFHTLTLRPYWFVNVDARNFEFINVDWNWQDTGQEIENLRSKKENIYVAQETILSAHRLLAIACRNLALSAEESHRYEEASKFRYITMDALRLEKSDGFAPETLRWWYWLASGYGEAGWRAVVMLIGVWLGAAALYTGVGFARWEPRVATQQEAAEARRDEVGEPLRPPRALTYSLGVMTLQKPEPRPATNAAQSLVMIETILGPVQAALLALAIRRKFMR